MSELRAPAGLFALAILALPASARAEEGVYAAFLGASASAHLSPETTPSVRAAVLLQSVLGLTDAVNWQGPATVDFRAGAVALTLGSGLEYVLHQSNHWQLAVAAGVAARLPVRPGFAFGLGPYLGFGARWLFAWGLGAALELKATYPFALSGEVPNEAVVHPSLCLFTEL